MQDHSPSLARPYLNGRQVVAIDQQHSRLHLIDGHIVLIENKHGVTINRDIIREMCNFLEHQIAGDYCWVINRKEDYSIALVEAYHELNSRARLKKIAVVSYRKLTDTVAIIEKTLCAKEFSVFNDVEQAIAWAGGGDSD